MTLILWLTTVSIILIGGTSALFTLIRKQYQIFKKITIFVAAWLICYFALLLAVSLTSNEKVLNLNREKRFCGCYFDCHLSASVEQIETTTTLGDATNKQQAKIGTFYIVTIKVRNDAKKESLALADANLLVIDKRGRQFSRNIDAERFLAKYELLNRPLDPFVDAIPPNSYTKRKVIFDLPLDIERPKLLFTEGNAIARLSELFLIGDDDSLFHKQRYFQLAKHGEIIFQDDDAKNLTIILN